MNIFSNNEKNSDTAVQDEIVNLTNLVATTQPMIENLSAVLLEHFATQDALSQTRMDMLNANLLTYFTTQDRCV